GAAGREGHSEVHRRAGAELGSSAASQQLLRLHQVAEASGRGHRAGASFDDDRAAGRHRNQARSQAALGRQARALRARRAGRPAADAVVPAAVAVLSGWSTVFGKIDAALCLFGRTKGSGMTRRLGSLALVLLMAQAAWASQVDALVVD